MGGVLSVGLRVWRVFTGCHDCLYSINWIPRFWERFANVGIDEWHVVC
jgi:hypothetical protein